MANFHVVNFCAKKILYKWTGNEKFLSSKFLAHDMQRHSRSSRLRAAWKSMKEHATEATIITSVDAGHLGAGLSEQ